MRIYLGAVDEDAWSEVLVETARGLRQLAVPYLVFGDPVPEPAGRRPAVRVVGATQAVQAEGLFDV